MQEELAETGRVWMRGAVAAHELDKLRARALDNTRPGARIDPATALWDQVAGLPALTQIAHFWPGMTPVRMVSFAKSGHSNWAVPWHQDRVIAVTEPVDIPGYHNWSRKAGAWHCEPPVEILQRMLFLRLHLDASTEGNGAMEIALGSHRLGLVPASDAEARAAECPSEITLADPGDILILSMLTLHSSRSSQDHTPRAVLRVDMSAQALPDPLSWAGEPVFLDI